MPHRLRELWPLLLAAHPVFGTAEWLGLAFAAVAVRCALFAAANPDWNGMAAFVIAVGALLSAFGTLANSLVKTWQQVTGNSARIDSVEENAAKAVLDAEAEIVRAKAEADAKIATARAEAKAEFDRKLAAVLAQNARQQGQIDSHSGAINAVKLDIAAARAATPDPDRVVRAEIVNAPDNPVPVAPGKAP